MTDEQRYEALYYLGHSLRGQKRHEDEVQVFEQMLRHAGGIETEKGASAGFQIAWAQVYGDNRTAAIETFEKVASSRECEPWLRANSLLRAGYYAMESGESARARVHLERLLSQHRDDVPPSQAWVISAAEQYLRKLDAQ